MVTPRPDREAKLSAAIDRAFGELFTIEAFKSTDDVNARRIPDTTRATMIDIVGVWEGPTASKTPAGRGSSSDDRAHNWVASFPSVSFEEAKLTWTIQEGDVVTRKLDGAKYAATAPYPNDGRTTILLTAKKRV